MKQSIIRSVVLIQFMLLALFCQAQAVQPMPLVPSEYLAKLSLTAQPSVLTQPLVELPKSKARKTASLLSLIAAPLLLGGIFIRNNRNVSTPLLLASAGLNLTSIYLTLRERKRDKEVMAGSL